MDQKEWRKILQAVSLVTYLGLLMVVSIGIGYFLGSKLDELLTTEPVFMIAGLLVGVAAGFYSVYQVIKGAFDDD